MSIRQENSKFVGTVIPQIPTWSVFYIEEKDKLETSRVMFYTIWEFELGNRKRLDIRPVSFTSDFLEEDEETSNFLGLSLTETPSENDWKDGIQSFKDHIKAKDHEVKRRKKILNS